MSNNSEKSQNNPGLVYIDDNRVIDTLQNSLYPGAKRESVEMVLSYCQVNALDPFTKPVHIVPMNVKQGDKYVWRDVIMPGIEMYRLKASRTNQYAGIDEAVIGPEITETLGGVTITYPEWISITVNKLVEGKIVSFSSGKVRFKENYSTAKRGSIEPNAMWKKRPYGQLEKCAEALALRRAFPDAIGAQPTAEEMEGKIISDIEGYETIEAVVSSTKQSVDTANQNKHESIERKLPELNDKELDEVIKKIRRLTQQNPVLYESGAVNYKITNERIENAINKLSTKFTLTDKHLSEIRELKVPVSLSRDKEEN